MIDLFAGAGGLSLGLAAAGFTPVRAVEVMPDAAATYEGLHGVPVDRRRLEDIPASELRSWRGATVVAGGPPCQPWSSGGLRRGAQDARDGFPAMLRALELIRPEAFVIENVAGLARAPYFSRLLEALAAWQVSFAVLDAADYGVPQHRRRMFLVGTRAGAFAFPQRNPEWVPAGAVIGHDAVGEPNPSIVTYAKRPDLRPSPYDGLLFNGGGRPLDLTVPARTVLASAGGNKTPFVDTLGVVPPYHASLLRGGPPRSGLVEGARRLTVAECAALQSFGPQVRFAGRRTVQYTLVGNAVPPLLAEAVGGALRAAL